MPTPFLLDTNAYYRLFQYPAPANADNFINLLKVGDVASFYISELTSLEIHSVLGKYRRGSSPKKCKCERTIDHEGKLAICSNIWVPEERKRINPRLYHAIFKLLTVS
jgi:hypothetical protein